MHRLLHIGYMLAPQARASSAGSAGMGNPGISQVKTNVVQNRRHWFSIGYIFQDIDLS